MKVSINTKLINRNKKISQYTLYIALALLTLGFIWTLRNNDPQKTLTGYLILIPSYILVQFSIYMANNWGSDPRPDEIVLNALKGLNNDYHIYIYTTKIPYLLVGPMGIWALTPHHHKGEIVYDAEKENYLIRKKVPGKIQWEPMEPGMIYSPV